MKPSKEKQLSSQQNSVSEDSSQEISNSSDNESTETEEDKFKGVSVKITNKRIDKGDYTVTNDFNKDIKGIEGTIAAHKSSTVDDYGLEYNKFMNNHKKLYNTDYNDLIFEYEFKTIIFSLMW